MIVSVRSQTIAWLLLWAFWTAVSSGRHPTLLVDAVATGLLLCAYAAAVYVERLVLARRYWSARSFAAYWTALFVVANVLTLAAVGAVRAAYLLLWRPDPRLFGFWTNYGIDFAGMALHLLGAALVVAVATRIAKSGGPTAAR